MIRLNILSTLLALLIFSGHLQSQEIVLQTSTPDTINPNSMYKYPDFLKGILHYKDGSSAAARFNVNMLLDEVQFINMKGDTLSLTDQGIIDNIVIGDHTYYFSKGAIEVIKSYKPVQLGVNHKIVIKVKNQRGAYGESLETNSVTDVRVLILYNTATSLEVNKNIQLTKVKEYYFVSDKSLILPATKNNLYKVFREHNQKALSAYLSDNKVNFRKEEDLCRLLSYCEQITR